MANVSADSAFWPPLPGISDLTLKFEETLFELTPSSLIIALAPFVLTQNLQQPVKVRRSPLLWAKLLVSLTMVGIELAALVFRAVDKSFLTETTLAAASVDLVAAIAVTAMLYVEHCHAIQSSAILGVYLLIGAMFDAVQCRSFFARPGLASVGALAAASCGLKTLLLILQEKNKRENFINSELPNALGKEATSGYWNRMLFIYLNPTFSLGFRNILKLSDLSNIGPQFRSKTLHSTFKKHVKGKGQGSKNALLFMCGRMWIWLILLGLVPRACFTGFSFSQPFILHRAIEIVDEEHASSSERGFFLFATFMSFAGATLSQAATGHMCNRLATRLRGSLVSAISEKNARLPQPEAKKSAAVTLMSNDVDDIVGCLSQIYDLVMTPIETAFGVYALSRFVGQASFAVIGPLVMATVAAYFLGGPVGSAVAMWNGSISGRVFKTSKILGQLKAVKMFGLGPIIGEYLQSLRQAEMRTSRKYRLLESAAALPVLCAELITPVAVIAAALFGNTFIGGMSSENVFPALSMVVLVKVPLSYLLNAYPDLMATAACFTRIQEFLELPEREDCRTLRERIEAPDSNEKIGLIKRARLPLVAFDHATIAPSDSETPILNDVSFTLYPGSVTVALGKNGSGKSLLLQSILGETSLIQGFIYITDLLVAFCGHQIWLRNVSIKANIIGHLPYDERLYRRVVRCCLLEEDFAALPGGEDYIVGTGGSKLSGGQRQRIGLARSLFARMSVIVLDDVFSSLDQKTANSILLRICGEDGLLRELNTAVVLSSYLPECLDVADQALMLDGNGNVSVETDLSSDQSRQKILETIASNIPALEQKEDAVEQTQQADAEMPGESPEDTVSQTLQTGDPGLYWLVINPVGKFNMAIWCLSMLCVSAGELLPDIYMRIWVERHAGDKAYFAGYASIGITTSLLFFTTNCIWFMYLMPRAAVKLHEQMVRTLMHATLGYLGATDNGILVNKFSQDMSLIARRLPVAFMRTFYVLFTTLIQTGIVASGSIYVAAVIPVVFFAVHCIQYFYLRTSRQMRALDLEAKSPLYTHFEETADGVLYIRAFGWQKMTLEEGFHLLDDSQKAFYYLYCIQQWLGLVLGLLVAVLATILMAFVLFKRESTSQAAIGLGFLNLIILGQVLEDLIQAWVGLETTVGALARLRNFMEKTPQESDCGKAQVSAAWPSAGKIELQNVTAEYSSNSSRPPVLQNVNLSIDAGKKVALVGRTGSGKSSVFLALLGFLEYQGKISIDGVDISSIPLDLLRSRIVTISQDQINLDDTVRTNLLPFTLNDGKAKMSEQKKQLAREKDAKLEGLLTRLGIWTHLSDKGGLDAMLSDAKYSHGEMQLFCLVRGIMRQQDTGSKLVLIDEATSSVEEGREKVAQEMMRESFSGCTILVIGHRESSVTGVDFTVEMAKGEVVRAKENKVATGGWAHSN